MEALLSMDSAYQSGMNTGNNGPRYSKELLDMLTQFIVNEIGGKALDGITYVLVRTDNTATQVDKDRISKYEAIRKEATLCGFGNNQLFRMYTLSNGVIFDIDMGITKKITQALANRVLAGQNENQSDPKYEDIIGNQPEKRRKSDMIALTMYLNEQFKAGKTIVDVALFSRNQVPEIVINGQLADGRYAIQKYKAYAIRFWDLEELNKNLLIPTMKIRIKQVAPGMILPTRTGVVFQLQLEAMPREQTMPSREYTYRESMKSMKGPQRPAGNLGNGNKGLTLDKGLRGQRPLPNVSIQKDSSDNSDDLELDL